MKLIFKYLFKDYKKEAVLGPAFKLLEAVFELIVPLVMANIIDIGIKNRDSAYILKSGGIMVLLGICGFCSTLVCQYMASVAAQGVGTSLRSGLFRHINSFSYAELDKFGVPSLVTRITNDVNQVQTATAMLIRLAVRAPFLVIGATVMAVMLDLKLSLIFFAVIPVVSAILYFVMSRSVPFYKTMQNKLDKLSRITRENLEGARVIRAFSKQEKEEKRFEEASSDLTSTAVFVGRISALLNPLIYAAINLAIAAIIWFGGIRVNSGALTQGQVIAFVNYMTQISLALVVVANLVVLFTKASACAVRIEEVFLQKPSVEEPLEESAKENPFAPAVEFKDVFFSYHKNNEYALSGASFKINRGETVGIIGGTGSGKTTLVNLIPRFYDVDKGEILVNGANVKEYKFKTLRGKIRIAPQTPELFSGSVEENIKWGKSDASGGDIERALSTAQAEDFVKNLPDGIGSKVLQGGKNFSGGQKQRLSIARALAGKPEILILDDSASALDYSTEAALRSEIRSRTEGITVIIVSQRVNSIRHADKIIVLDEGEIAGIGTHRELFGNCGIYREICLSQLSEEEARK